MKNKKIRFLAVFLTVCILSFTFAFSVSATDETYFKALLSGKKFALWGEKYTVSLIVNDFAADEFLGFTCEIDYDSDVFEVDSKYLEIASENESYPIKNGENGWVCWINNTINGNVGVITLNVLNDSSEITSLNGEQIECFVEFKVKEAPTKESSVIKIDTDSALVGVFSETAIESKLGSGSEITVEILKEMPEIYRKLVLKDESELSMKNSEISGIKIVKGFREYTTVSQLLDNFKNELSNLSVVKNGKVLSENDYLSSDSQIQLTVEGVLVDFVDIILIGDVDGSSDVDATDYLNVKNYFLGKNVYLEDWALAAADVESNGEIDSTDYIKLKSYFYGFVDIYA